MSVERSDAVAFSTREFLKAPKDILYREVAKAGSKMIDFQDPNRYIDEFYFLRQNRLPIVYANHESHSDGGVFIEASDRMNKVGNPHIEFDLPLALSLRTSDQSSMLTHFYTALRPWMEKHRVHPIEVAREADKEKYNLEDTRAEFRSLLEVVDSNKGLMVFPQASVSGGRIDPVTWKRRGMIKVQNDLVPRITRRSVNKRGRGVAFQPIAIHKTFNIYDPGIEGDPSSAGITKDAWNALVKQKMGFRPKLATAVVGEPFTDEDIVREGVSLNDFDAVNDFMMRRIAELLPEDARGCYR